MTNLAVVIAVVICESERAQHETGTLRSELIVDRLDAGKPSRLTAEIQGHV